LKGNPDGPGILEDFGALSLFGEGDAHAGLNLPILSSEFRQHSRPWHMLGHIFAHAVAP